MFFFKYLFSREIKDWETRLENTNQAKRKLLDELTDLKKELSKQESRFKRLEYLVNIRLNDSKRLLLERTKKGIEILTSLDFGRKEIEIFNIDCKHFAENRELVLWFAIINKIIKIVDIQGGKSLGHGSIAINHLVNFAKKNNMDIIIGDISSVDSDHFDRLYYFYKKNGFTVDKKNSTLRRLI